MSVFAHAKWSTNVVNARCVHEEDCAAEVRGCARGPAPASRPSARWADATPNKRDESACASAARTTTTTNANVI